MRVEPQQLKAFILDSGLVKKEDLEKADNKATKTGKKIEDILIHDGLIKEEDLIHLKAYILGIPFINLEKEKIPLSVLKIIPQPIARKHNIVSYKKEDRNLEVAMLNPEDLQTIEFIKKKANLKVLPRLTTPSSIKNALIQYEESLESEFGSIIKEKVSEIKHVSDDKDKKTEEKNELVKAAEELPIIKIVDVLLKHAILQRASDIHVEPGEKEVVVRYRIDGILHDAMVLPKRVQPGIIARIKVLSSLKLDEHRLPQDGRFKIETEEYKISFRVSILPTFYGEKIVMRLLPETSKAFTLEELGFWGDLLEDVHVNIKRPNGLILVTGPTGSGKTTTLYSVMDILNTPGVNISTVEDPIEYTMPRINQSQVKPEIGFTFASGLRSLVRQDPDIIMVGEIRDKETAELAINAALTGHLVLSTLHTNTAAGAVPRLIDMGVEPFLAASTLRLVVAQRLVRKLASDMEEYYFKKEEIQSLAKQYNMEKILNIFKEEKIIKKDQGWENIKFGRPKKTKGVEGGYKGRVGIYEVLSVSDAIKELIIKERSADEIQVQAEKEKMLTMFEDGFVKAARRLTSIEEVLRVATEK
ncbi:MAG: GspE/PulE family protein [Candidatus Pacebacteria bacterium]|nr:GspE/PulE family protein [Candidatus Paceibacterota bacterium]